jgi:flagellar hook-basal body complex protein FliE
MGAKKAYQDKMEAQLKEWRAKIDVLKAKADKAEADKRAKYYEKIETLRSRQKAAAEKLKELQKAGEGAWTDVKTGMEKAWNDLKTSIEEASKKF